MTLKFEDLRILQAAEAVADSIWEQVVRLDPFVRNSVGGQLARAADSIGANIAEAFGRFHYGEKLQFLYFARGSLFETKYWLNRILARDLMPSDQVQEYASQLSNLARQLNAFASSLRAQRLGNQPRTKSVAEAPAEYIGIYQDYFPESIITDSELKWLHTLPNH
jgi:four helix bundle protein